MPRDLLPHFLTQYLTQNTSFNDLMRTYGSVIHRIAFQPGLVSDAECVQLATKLQQDLESYLSNAQPVDRTYRVMLQLFISIESIDKARHLIEPHISDAIRMMRRNKKLVAHIQNLIHQGEEDISDLYWVYLIGSEAERTAIQDMLKMMPFELPFIKFLRQILGLVESGLAPELFPTLLFRICQESEDGQNDFQSDEELNDPANIERLKGFTQGTVVQLRRRLSRVLALDHTNSNLCAVLQQYPVDETIAPTPLLERLCAGHVNYRPTSVLSADFANRELLKQLTSEEADLGSFKPSSAQCLSPEVLTDLLSISSQPMDPSLAFVIARCLMHVTDLDPVALLENASVNPALYSTLLHRLDSLSSEVKQGLIDNIEIIGQQGYAAVKSALQWLLEDKEQDTSLRLVESALGSASGFCPHLSSLLQTSYPTQVGWKAMHTVQLTLWDKQRNIHGCIDFIDLNNTNPLAPDVELSDVIVCAEICGTHFSSSLRAAFEQKFLTYMQTGSPQPEVVYWLAHSKNVGFQDALRHWVQAALDVPASNKWQRYERFLLHYATGLVPSFQACHESLQLDESIVGTLFLDKAKRQTNFDFFAFLRFSFRLSSDEFTVGWNGLTRSYENNHNNLSFERIAQRNPKLFTETYEWHIRNEWRRLSERNWYLNREYNRIIPKLQSDVRDVFSNSRLTNLLSQNRSSMEQKNKRLVQSKMAEEFPKSGRSQKEFNTWKEEVCQERYGMAYWQVESQRVQEANTESSLAVLQKALHRQAHTGLHVFTDYKQHLSSAWGMSEQWTQWDTAISKKMIQKLSKRRIRRWGKDPFPFESLLMPYDKENPPKKKAVDEDALWPWLSQQIQYRYTDNIGTCLKCLLESHDDNSDISVSNGAIEEYMRRIFMHRISLTQLQRYLKGNVIDNIAEYHKSFFFSWLAYLLRTGTSTVVVGRFLSSSHIPLKEVVAHRTIRRTAVMVRNMFDQIVRFLEDDDSPRSDRIFNLIMEVALDESEPKTTLAVALVNLGFSQRIQNWIASHPERVDAFMQLHADWVDEPDWHDPFFPIYIALWQNQRSRITRQNVIAFLRKGWGAARYSEGLMHCVVSHYPEYFGDLLTMITNPHPTPSEVIHRNVIRNAILGLGRIRVALSQEDRMLILEKLEAHYRREVLPLVQLLTDEEWTLDLTVAILEAISEGGMRQDWNFIYEERHDFEHWLSAVERISVWNWWVQNPIQQKLSQFSSKSYREMAKHSPERIWNLFKKCSNTTFFSKLIAQLFKTSAEVDTLEKIQIFLKFGLSKKVRVHWALQFSNIEDVEETFEYLNLLNNDALRSEILKHHFHLLLPVLQQHTQRFLEYLIGTYDRLDFIQRLESTGNHLSVFRNQYPMQLLSLYSTDQAYQTFSFITELQNISSLTLIERYLQLALDSDKYLDNDLIGRWYRSNGSILVSSVFLKYVFEKNLVGTYEDDILTLPDSVLHNQAVIWEYLTEGRHAPQKPQETDWRYRNNPERFQQALETYHNTFYMQLQTRMVQDEASHTFLIEQTFWNAQSYYLNHRGGREFLKEHVDVLVALAKRERSQFAIRFVDIFTETTGFFNEGTFLPMLRREILIGADLQKLLRVLSNHVSEVHSIRTANEGREEKDQTRIPVCRLVTEFNNLPKNERGYLQRVVREMIKEPTQYRLLFTEPFFVECLPTLIQDHPASMGAYIRRLPQLLETSTALQDLGPTMLAELPLYVLKSALHEVTTLFFYRGDNPWRSVLLERFETEPKLKQAILEYALSSLAERTTVTQNCLEMDLSDLKNPVMTWSNNGVFKDLPEKEKNHDTVMESWTDEDDNEYSSNVSGWNTQAQIHNFEQQIHNSITFHPWSGSFENAASQRHVFKDGEAPELVHNFEGHFQTEEGYTSSSSIRVQTHYQNRVLRFVFGALKTNNVFEKLSAAQCAYQHQIYTDLSQVDLNSPASWGSWRRNASWWTFFVHHPLMHPHAQSLVESLSTLHGGYDYPNLDLNIEFELIDSLWDVSLLDNLSTKTLMSLLFCPSETIQKDAKSALKLRRFKGSDVRFVFELPENQWLWEHVTTRPMATLKKIWRNVLEGMVWEDPKRQRQVAWFLKTLYTPSQAENLIQEIETAVLQGRGWVTSPGILYHRDFVWNAVQNMDLDLKIRGLIAMSESPLYEEALPALEEMKSTVIGSLHILSQNITPDAGIGYRPETVYTLFNSDLEREIEDRVLQVSETELTNVEAWRSLALHQKVGRFALKLTEALTQQAPELVPNYSAYLLDKVDDTSVSIWIEHMKIVLQHLPESHQSNLLNLWIDGMMHATLARVRSFSIANVRALVESEDVHEAVYQKLLKALSRRPKYDGMSNDIYEFVTTEMSATHARISLQWIWTLVNGSQHWGHVFAYQWLRTESYFDSASMSVDQLVKLGMHTDHSIRDWALSLLQQREIASEHLIALMPLLEMGAFDVQVFVADLLRSRSELPLSLVLRLVDSVKSAQSPTAISVTDLGTELLERYYGVDLNQDIVLQLSEHPTDDAEDYVASKLAEDQSAERLLALVPYFKRVLTRLNSGRQTRDSILQYVRDQALIEQSRAESVLELLEWMCNIHVVVDQLYSLETLALVQEKFPTLQTSIEL